jgi:hypothetical protein
MGFDGDLMGSAQLDGQNLVYMYPLVIQFPIFS